jgi:hypothetical protein
MRQYGSGQASKIRFDFDITIKEGAGACLQRGDGSHRSIEQRMPKSRPPFRLSPDSGQPAIITTSKR